MLYKSTPIETGSSDQHKLVVTSYLRSHNNLKLKPKNIIYRETNKINEELFRNDISNLALDELQKFTDPLAGFVTLFKSIVD